MPKFCSNDSGIMREDSGIMRVGIIMLKNYLVSMGLQEQLNVLAHNLILIPVLSDFSEGPSDVCSAAVCITVSFIHMSMASLCLRQVEPKFINEHHVSPLSNSKTNMLPITTTSEQYCAKRTVQVIQLDDQL